MVQPLDSVGDRLSAQEPHDVHAEASQKTEESVPQALDLCLLFDLADVHQASLGQGAPSMPAIEPSLDGWEKAHAVESRS